MSVVEKFAAFVGSLSPEETGEVMPLMISFMQSNLGRRHDQGRAMPAPTFRATAPTSGCGRGPGAPRPPACHLGQNPCRRQCPACSRAG